jgi:hypothetical protein
MPEFINQGRGWGKTTKAIEWVKAGKRVPGYPGWSRILLVLSMEEANRLRNGPTAPLDYRQVFYIEEWQRARRGRACPAIAIDNLDIILFQMVGAPVDLITWGGM